MAFKSVENSGNWLAGGTYTFLVKATWFYPGVGTRLIGCEFLLGPAVPLLRYWNPREADYSFAAGEPVLFDAAGIAALEALIAADEISRESNANVWSFAGNALSSPTITSVVASAGNNRITDPYTGKRVLWTSEYLFGQWLTVSLTLPADLDDGFYYLASLYSEWNFQQHRWQCQSAKLLVYQICVGEDYWSGGAHNPAPAEVTVTWDDDEFENDIETLPITILPMPQEYPPPGRSVSYVFNGLTHKIKLSAPTRKNMQDTAHGLYPRK